MCHHQKGLILKVLMAKDIYSKTMKQIFTVPEVSLGKEPEKSY